MGDSSVLLTFDELASAVEGSILANGSSAVGISAVATDSRAVVAGSLFVPLIGEFQDGHAYVRTALESGASAVFIDNLHAKKDGGLYRELAARHSACVIAVENTLRALQDAARFYRAKFPNLLRIGVTGSSGKTTCKEILASLFQQRYKVVMNEGNLNSETGLPLSVFSIRDHHEVGIFELGMNRRGEIREIAQVLSPDLALITNIGTAHIGILGSKAAIAEEKKSIFGFFSDTCVGFVPERDEWTAFLSQVHSGRVETYGRFSTQGFEGSEDLGIDGTLIAYRGLKIRFPLPGPYNLMNALGAISVSEHAGLEPDEIKKGLEGVTPLFGRAQVLREQGRTVIVDCYNANPDSMEKALEFYSSLPWRGKKVLVLGSMLELGDESEREHDRICALVSRSDADQVLLFGDDMLSAGRRCDWAGMDVELCGSMEELNRILLAVIEEGDLVFLKGSRGMALERTLPSIVPGYSGGSSHA